MVANNVDDAALRLAGVMEIGEGIAKAGGQMQERCWHLAAQAEVTISGTARATFEQAQDAAHIGVIVEGCHKMHLGGAGVGETDIYPAGQHGFYKCFCAVHWHSPGPMARL